MKTTSRLNLELPLELRRALLVHRVRYGRADAPATVRGETIAELERILHIRVPEDLLGVFAATQRDPYQMVVLTEEARELVKLPERLVVVERSENHGRHSEVPDYWYFESGQTPAEESLMRRWSLDPGRRETQCSMLEFVKAYYLAGEPTEPELVAAEGLLRRFRPAVVTENSAALRSVTHPKFGSGFVLQEYDDGNHKVVVDFPNIGIKLLLANRVNDLSGTAASPFSTPAGQLDLVRGRP